MTPQQSIIIEDYKEVSDPNSEHILFKLKWSFEPDPSSVHLAVFCANNWLNEGVSDEDADKWIETASPFFAMMIKWDGCAHCFFDYIHLCGPEGMTRFARLLEYTYKRAAELIKNNDIGWNPAIDDIIKVDMI